MTAIAKCNARSRSGEYPTPPPPESSPGFALADLGVFCFFVGVLRGERRSRSPGASAGPVGARA